MAGRAVGRGASQAASSVAGFPELLQTGLSAPGGKAVGLTGLGLGVGAGIGGTLGTKALIDAIRRRREEQEE